MIPQNIVSGAPDDNAASVFRNAADYAVLSGDCLLNDVRAEIQIVEDFRGICVDVRYEFAVESAFLGGECGHFLIIKRNSETLCNDLSDLLAGGAVLPRDRYDYAGTGRSENGV